MRDLHKCSIIPKEKETPSTMDGDGSKPNHYLIRSNPQHLRLSFNSLPGLLVYNRDLTTGNNYPQKQKYSGVGLQIFHNFS